MTRSSKRQTIEKVRRPHTKSRNGCQNCKKRRVKCDEGRPSCQRCEVFGVKCDYVDTTGRSTCTSPEGGSPGLSTSSSSGTTKKRGRPRKDWDVAALSSKNLLPMRPSHPSGIASLDDLHLLFHYTNSTARTIAEHGRVFRMWQSAVPQLGFKHPFLLELLLSLAALHLSRLRDGEKEHYLSLADSHQSAGLQGLTTAMTDLNPSNSVAIYVSTTLACYLHFGKGPSPGDCLVFSNEGPAAWFTMFRGIRSIEALSTDNGFGALIRDMEENSDEEHSGTTQTQLSPDIRLHWSGIFDDLEKHSRTCDAKGADLSIKALESLTDVYKKTFGTTEIEPLAYDETGHLPFAWLYSIDDAFVRLAQEHEDVPLVILSFFALLLKRLYTHWWIEGWAEHIAYAVRSMVSVDYHRFVDWSITQVNFACAKP